MQCSGQMTAYIVPYIFSEGVPVFMIFDRIFLSYLSVQPHSSGSPYLGCENIQPYWYSDEKLWLNTVSVRLPLVRE